MEAVIVLIALACIWFAEVLPILRAISITKVLRDPDLRESIRKSLNLRRAAIIVWLLATSFFPLLLIDNVLIWVGGQQVSPGVQMQFGAFYFFFTPVALVVFIVLMVSSSNSDGY